MTFIKDDIVHLNAVIITGMAVWYASSGFNKAMDAKASIDKTYDCYCYVISNFKEYGCPEEIVRQGLNITQLCSRGGQLFEARENANSNLAKATKITAAVSVVLVFMIAVLFLRPCTRFRKWTST